MTAAGGSPTEHDLLAIAHQAARAAATELAARFGREPQGVRSKSSPTDPVSEADLAAEIAIRRVLAQERPDDAILGEEGGATGESDGGTGLRWIVDPLDGTANYLHGIPEFGVSIACVDTAGALAAVVLNPLSGELFAATRSGPATLGGEPIATGSCEDLGLALVATGFGYDSAVREVQGRVLARVLPRVANIRRFGAAALDMCRCASGYYDAYYERGVQAWDVAAGTLVCSRVGLEVRTLPAVGILPVGILVAPPALADELFELVA